MDTEARPLRILILGHSDTFGIQLADRSVVQQFCREHHFTWFDTEAALLPGARERSFLPDGVHRNPEAHRHFADIILPVLGEMAEKALENEPGPERQLSAQV